MVINYLLASFLFLALGETDDLVTNEVVTNEAAPPDAIPIRNQTDRCAEDMKKYKCDEYFRQNPEAAADRRQCNESYIDLKLDVLKGLYVRCPIQAVRILASKAVESAQFAVSLADRIQEINRNQVDHFRFLKECNQDSTLKCKRQLAQEGGHNFSDEQLRTDYTAEMLYGMKRTHERKRVQYAAMQDHAEFTDSSYEDKRKNSESANLKAKNEVDSIIEEASLALERFGIQMACYNEAKKMELLCYGVGMALLDPLTVGSAGLTALARIAKLKYVLRPFPRSVDSVYLPVSMRSQCPTCPRQLRFSNYDHYNEHLWKRDSHQVSDHETPEAAWSDVQKVISLPKNTAAEKHREVLSRIRSFLEKAKNGSARPDADTTIWSPEQRTDLIGKAGAVKWTALEGKSSHPNHILFQGEVEGVRVNMVVCARKPCSSPRNQSGDVITVYPVCGRGVFVVPRISKIQRALSALEEEQLSLNKDAREGFVREKPCP